MSNIVGLSLIAAFLVLEAVLFVILHKVKLKEKGQRGIVLAMALLPMFLLTAVDSWDWPATINPNVDLPFSWFHFIFIALVLLFAFGATRVATLHIQKDTCEGRLSKTDWTVFVFGVLLTGIEIYKQIFYGTLFTGYQWYLFPFQFCSVPLYVCLIAPWIKNQKRKEACYSFIGIFGLIAGLAVMAYPTTVFTNQISICIHTMVWHGTMIVVGVYLVARYRIGTSLVQWKQASAILSMFILIAIVMNMAIHLFAPQIGLNPFFLSPWISSPFPVLSTILAKGQSSWGVFWGWLVYLISYILAFFLGGMLVYLVAGIFTHKPNPAFSKQPA